MKLSKEYIDYIESLEWRKLRASSFKRYGKRCQCCGSTKKIHGHHLIYRVPLESGRTEDIMPLCERCHETVHATPKIDRGFRLLRHPDQRRQFIIRCFRPVAVTVMPKPKPKPAPRPQRIKPPPDPAKIELAHRIQIAKIRGELEKRGINGLGLSPRDVSGMSSASIKRRLKHHKRARKRAATKATGSVIEQMRAQLAANPGCTHFVFS